MLRSFLFCSFVLAVPATSFAAPDTKVKEPLSDITIPPVNLSQYYKKYMLAQGVHILGTARTSDWAMRKVHETVSQMLGSLNRQEDVARFKDAKVVIINYGDTPTTMPYFEILDPQFRREVEVNYRGFSAGYELTVVTEEMMCKTGVQTRGASDRAYRAFDQVVHEWGHTMEAVLGLYGATEQMAPQTTLAAFWKQNPRELFAMITQAWFHTNYSYEAGLLNGRARLKSLQPQAYHYLEQTFAAQNPWQASCP